MKETREHEERRVTVTKGRTIHSIKADFLFSYRFCYIEIEEWKLR